MNSDEIRALDQQYVMQTYRRNPLAIDHGKGAVLWSPEGKEYIDFTSGIGVCSLGCANEAWANAIYQQAMKVGHISNLFYTEPYAKLASKLVPAAGMKAAFFGNSGAEANECAVKIARKYGERRGAYKIVTLENSFHGRTLTTLAATGQEGFHKDFLPLTEGFLYAKAGDIDAIDALLDGSVCAVMIETVQGEGGVVPMDPDLIKALSELCKERDVLLIVDEVQTGIGRTGYFYSYQGYGVQPDVATSAKGLAGGLPIGTCLVTEKLRDIIKPGQQGSTFGGNPVVCAGAREVVRRVSAPEFLQAVLEKGEYITKRLENLPQVEFVRGRGLMLGIKLKSGDAHDVLVECAKQGLLVLTAKELVRFLPPLTITVEEIDKGLSIFAKVLQEVN